MAKLFGTSYDVIKGFGLPQLTTSFLQHIYMPGRVPHPALANNTHVETVPELYNRMNMVWHDYKAIEIVPHAIEITDRVGDDFGVL
jgi:hypothetical protein